MKQLKIKRKGETMGIELGSIGSIAGVATAVGRGISGLGRVGGEVPAASIGPISAPISLEGFVPMNKAFVANLDLTVGRVEPKFNMGDEIVFRSQSPQVAEPEIPLNEDGVLAEAEYILTEARKTEPQVINPWTKVVEEVKTDSPVKEAEFNESVWEIIRPAIEPRFEPLVVPVVKPAAEPAVFPVPAPLEARAVKAQPELVSAPKTEARPAQVVVPAVKPVEAEQVKEEVITEKAVEESVPAQEEQVEVRKEGLVVDTEKVLTRDHELNQAAEQAAIEAEALGVEIIEGEKLVKHIVPQHHGDRSETLNEEDPNNTILDGSFESAKEAINVRAFNSLSEAKRFVSFINRKFRPEKRGQEDDITEEEHKRVHRDHKHASRRSLQILKTRVVKKTVSVVSEPTLQSETGGNKIINFPQFAQALKAA